MSLVTDYVAIPKTLSSKLRRIRSLQICLVLIRALALGTFALSVMMLMVMVFDWLSPIFDSGIRASITILSVSLFAGVVLRFSVKPIARALSWARAAYMADQSYPQLQERWRVITEMAATPAKKNAVTRAMLDQVTSEAVALGQSVKPVSVVDSRPAIRATAACLLVVWFTAGFIVLTPKGRVLASRFWSFGADITATKIESISKDLAVPRGEPAVIQFATTGHLPSHAKLFLMQEFDVEDQIERVTEVIEVNLDETELAEYSIPVVDQNFHYRIQAGDDRTAWYTIESLPRPQFKEINVTVDAPAYLDRPRYERPYLPSRIKVAESSRISFRFRPLEPIANLELSIQRIDENGEALPPQIRSIPKSDQQDYRLEMTAAENLIVSPTMISNDGLTQREELLCRIQVIKDKPPVARLIQSDEELEASPDDEIEIEFEAHDDHGVAKAELLVFEESDDENQPPKLIHVQEVQLGDQAMEKHVLSSVRLSLSELDLSEQKKISFAVRVTDNRERSSRSNPGDSLPTKDVENNPAENHLVEAGAADDGPAKDGPAKDVPAKDGPADDEPANANAAETHSVEASPRETNSLDEDATLQNKSMLAEQSAGRPADKSAEADQGSNQPAAQADGNTSADQADIDGENINAARFHDVALADAASADEMSEGNATDDGNGAPETQDSTTGESKIAAGEMQPGSSSAAEGRQASEESDRVNPDSPNRSNAPANSNTIPGESLAANNLPIAPTQESRPFDESEMIRRFLDLDELAGNEGQNATSGRIRVVIRERIAMEGQAFETDKSVQKIRADIEKIDQGLELAQTNLTMISTGAGQENESLSQRAELLLKTDEKLKLVVSEIVRLKERTVETPLAFVGLQLLNMGRVHVTPARDRVIWMSRNPDGGGDAGRVKIQAIDALGHINQAREFIAEVTRRISAVGNDESLAEELEDLAKIYEIYVENTHRLLRGARQNRNPLKRKTAILEVDQEYLARRTEIEEMRRDMMAEFARMLADDPRLLRRYLDSVRRRQTSLRDRLTEATEIQEQIAEEVASWQAVDENQRETLWRILIEFRLTQTQALAGQAGEIADRIESTMPLELDADRGTPQAIIHAANQASVAAQDVALAARRMLDNEQTDVNALIDATRRLGDHTGHATESLERLEFEFSDDEEIEEFLAERLLDVRNLVVDVEHFNAIAAGIARKDFASIAGTEQERLASTTQQLVEDLDGLQESLGELFERDELTLPEEIAQKAQQLDALLTKITMNQAAAVYCLTHDTLDNAISQLDLAVDRFYEAEELFDQIRREAVAVLDQQEMDDPNIADLREPTIDEFLTRLEREPRLFQQLELGNRSTNLRVIQDWMTWQQNSGDRVPQDLIQAAKRARQRAEQQEELKLQQPTQNRAEETEQLREMLEKSIGNLQARLQQTELGSEQSLQIQNQIEQMQKMLDEEQGDASAQWNALVKSARARQLISALAGDGKLPDEQWNKLFSQLDNGLWQVRGRRPPEQFRRAIEQYQDLIREFEE